MHKFTLLILLVVAAAAAAQSGTASHRTDSDGAKEGGDITLSAAEIAAEQAWLESLGVKGSPLIEHPFSPPWSGRSFVVPTAWYKGSVGKTIAADALRKDLPLLHMVMEKAYGGWDSAAQRGWDWEKWFADWDRLLAGNKGKELPVREALAPFGELEDFQLDNHSGPWRSANFGSGSRSALLSAAPTGDCVEMKTSDGKKFAIDVKDLAQRPKRALLADLTTTVWYISYPMKRGEMVSLQCGNAWIDATAAWPREWPGPIGNVLKLAQTDKDVPSFHVISPKISYLRLPTFTAENNELLVKLIPTLKASAGQEQLLIVDLRGNNGGSSMLQLFLPWMNLDEIRHRIGMTQRLPQSCFYDALRWGYLQSMILNITPPISKELKGQIQEDINSVLKPVPEDCPVTIKEEKSEWHYAQHKFGDRVRFLVLVDNGCGSDCEATTYFLAGDPRSVIVGVNTYGVAQFIQPGYFMLPYSRLPFRIALGRSDIYGDNRSFDGYGFDVDVLLAREEEQSPEAILKLAERLLTRNK